MTTAIASASSSSTTVASVSPFPRLSAVASADAVDGSAGTGGRKRKPVTLTEKEAVVGENAVLGQKMYISEIFVGSPDDKATGADGQPEPKIFQMLFSFMRKVCALKLPATPLPLVRPGMQYLCLTLDGSFSLETMPIGVTFKWDTYARVDAKHFYVLRELGHGVHGTVCLACTSSGSHAVIKFQGPKNVDKDEQLQSEVFVWRKVIGARSLPVGDDAVRVHVQRDTQEHVMVMPFFKPSDQSSYDADTLLYVARNAATRLANAGYEHNDIVSKWCHVGLFRDKEGNLDAVLLDLARVSKIEPDTKDARTAAVDRMMSALGAPAPVDKRNVSDLQTPHSKGATPRSRLPVQLAKLVEVCDDKK
jgi:hypothetical protein